MRIILSVVLALACGLLFYTNAAMVFLSDGEAPGWFVAVFFVGGSILAGWLLLKNTKRASKVLKRGALFGAILWLAIIPSSMILAGKGVAASGAQGEAEQAGAAVGGGIVAMMGAGLGITMALLCLIVFVIVHFTAKEMAPDTVGAAH